MFSNALCIRVIRNLNCIFHTVPQRLIPSFELDITCPLQIIFSILDKWKILLCHKEISSHFLMFKWCNLSFNTFPDKPCFLRVCSTSLSITLWEKEKLLITSNFSFSHSVFYPFGVLHAIFIKVEPYPGGSVVSVLDSWPGGCEFDPRLRRLFFRCIFGSHLCKSMWEK